MSVSHTIVNPRRHDLDALRAFAMLLGIALHGALSFMPIPWPVQDSQQNELIGLVLAAVHGFRMPVFFVMSGFFTAMLWRQRGLRSMLNHRFRRIFLPLLLGVITVVPAVNWMVKTAILTQSRQTPEISAADTADLNRPDPASGMTPLSLAVISGKTETVRQLLASGADATARNADGSAPLTVAALLGKREAAALLIDQGAEIEAATGDGSTPLHTAAFFGRAEIVELLIDKGADRGAKNAYGQTPLEVTYTDWKTTQMIADMVQVEVVKGEVEAGRSRAAELLGSNGAGGESAGAPRSVAMKVKSLMVTPFFHHLWFLWFLCWLVAGFGCCAALVDRLGWSGFPSGWVLSPLRFLWLIPLTMIPQWFMGRMMPVFGSDTSAGLVPMPHVLAYYAIFFGFGALYHGHADAAGRVGRWWWLSLPLGVVIFFPLGVEFAMGVLGFRDAIAPPDLHRLLGALMQASYAWVMTFGLMGLFRRLLTRANSTIRYISDASYWLYLSHLPLIIGAQILVQDWSLPLSVKFLLVCGVVTALLLLVYQVLVRYTWLGTLLNGPRKRPGVKSA